MLDILVISLGAIAGANARYFLSRFAARVTASEFPYGTLIINVSGSLLAGFFLVWTVQRTLVDPRWRLLILVGFCGSFTTFSGYAVECMAFFEQGRWLLFIGNFLGNNILCLAAALAGMTLARVL